MSKPRKKKVPMKLEEIVNHHSVIKKLIAELEIKQRNNQTEINALEDKNNDIKEAIEALDSTDSLLSS